MKSELCYSRDGEAGDGKDQEENKENSDMFCYVLMEGHVANFKFCARAMGHVPCGGRRRLFAFAYWCE